MSDDPLSALQAVPGVVPVSSVAGTTPAQAPAPVPVIPPTPVEVPMQSTPVSQTVTTVGTAAFGIKAWSRVCSTARQVAAVAALVIGALENSGTVAGSHTGASVLMGVGGVVLAIEHYVANPSTGTPTP